MSGYHLDESDRNSIRIALRRLRMMLKQTGKTCDRNIHRESMARELEAAVLDLDDVKNIFEDLIKGIDSKPKDPHMP